jgi:hypothetical protein
MPRNCSRDLERIVEFVDDVLLHGSDHEKQTLKAKFLLQDLAHDDDVAGALTMPLGAWQGMQLYSGHSAFYKMCDAIEGAKPGADVPHCGVGMPAALDNFARWWSEEYFPGSE